jgi:hypothetical protein
MDSEMYCPTCAWPVRVMATYACPGKAFEMRWFCAQCSVILESPMADAGDEHASDSLSHTMKKMPGWEKFTDRV